MRLQLADVRAHHGFVPSRSRPDSKSYRLSGPYQRRGCAEGYGLSLTIQLSAAAEPGWGELPPYS